MAARSAQVSFKNQIAGYLEETAIGGTRFIYNEDWAETIACALPIARREHEWAQGLHPFFQHLGPEGWLRERQARVAHVAEEDDLGLLLQHGSDCIGAVGVLPVNEDASYFTFSDEATNPRRTVSGVQRKLLITRENNIFHPAGPVGPAPYIAKFNSETLNTLVRNEHLSLKWVRAILGAKEVTEFTLGHVTEINELALIVTRFDRTEDGQKLRTEDFAQVLCKPRGQDYAGKYDSSYEEVAGVIRSHSVRAEIDLAKLFRRLLAFVLISNGDAHLKNFSLLERPEGLRLSPVYDVVNVGVYGREGYSQNLALSIGDEVFPLEAVTKQVLVAFGARIGLSKASIDSAFRDAKTRAKRAQNILPDVDEGRDAFGANFAEIVRNRCARLLEE